MRMRAIRRSFLVLLAAVLAVLFFSIGSPRPMPAAYAERSVAPVGGRLSRAVDAYRNAQQSQDRDLRLDSFRRAARLFAAAAEDGPASAELWANAGTAALQAEQLGEAILFLRRALALDPSLRRARQNLDHARSLLPQWLPLPRDHGVLDDFLGAKLTPEERRGAASLAFLLAALLAAVGIARRNALARSMALLPLLVWALLLGSSFVFSRSEAAGKAAVVMVETPARAADSFNAPLRFAEPVPAGAEITIETRRDRWVRVLFADGRDAWLSASAIANLAD